MLSRRWSLLAAAMLGLLGGASAQNIPEPSGYRMEEYRAPVPETLKGAKVIGVPEAEKLWREKSAAFFDVLPRTPKPADLPPKTVWREKPRQDIPGSLWLANVGYGEINADTEAYFKAGLAAAGAASKDAPIVFYCMKNCWMSFNAAKRAVSWGYSAVHWFPLGTDGWAEAGLPLEDKLPFEAN